MRKTTLFLLTATSISVVGFYLLRLDGEHLYTGHDSLYRFLGGLGLFLLFIAFVLMLVVYGRLSFMLRPTLALLLGVGSIVIAWRLWRFLAEIVSVHNWNFVFLVLPLIFFLSGLEAMVLGTVRLFKREPVEQNK